MTMPDLSRTQPNEVRSGDLEPARANLWERAIVGTVHRRSKKPRSSFPGQSADKRTGSVLWGLAFHLPLMRVSLDLFERRVRSGRRHSSRRYRARRRPEEVEMNRHRILVAYDGSEESFWALEQAADAAQHADAELGIVTVMPQVLDAPRDALRYIRERGLDATLHAPVGDPATEIAKVADDGAYHTVYLGTRDGAVARALAPSVSHQVALRAPASVVIAR
jgi:nucleotide-binding universal stress UspA family protein